MTYSKIPDYKVYLKHNLSGYSYQTRTRRIVIAVVGTLNFPCEIGLPDVNGIQEFYGYIARIPFQNPHLRINILALISHLCLSKVNTTSEGREMSRNEILQNFYTFPWSSTHLSEGCLWYFYMTSELLFSANLRMKYNRWFMCRRSGFKRL